MSQPAEDPPPLARQLVGFLAVGGSAALGYAAVSATLIARLDFPAWLASALAYALMIPLAYWGQRRFAFRSSAPHAAAVPKYFAVQLGGLVAAAGLSQLVHDWVGVPPFIAFLGVAAIVAAGTFLAMRTWIFLETTDRAPARLLTSPRIAAAIVALVCLCAIIFRASIPISAEAYLLHDDALFMSHAHSILNGEWLGPFDNRTLAKGAFYPLFIAASHLAGLPLKIAEGLFQLACAGIAAYALWRLSRSRWLGVGAFALFALNPLFWNPMFARVVRDNIYIGEGLALVALAALIALDTRAGAERRLARVALLVAFGMAFAAYWLTREESVWLYPSLAVVALGGLVERYAVWRARGKAPIAWVAAAGRVLGQAAIAVGGFAVLAGTIALVNYNVYGVFLTSEFREGNFVAAYSALMRIKPDTWEPYILFPEDVAHRAYAVSPAAAELKAGLDGPAGENWRNIGCKAIGLDPCPNAYVGGWFAWAMRDAVRVAGHYDTAAEGQAFFARLADEIDAACDAQKLPCLPPRATMAPPFHSEYLDRGFHSFLTALGLLAGTEPVIVGTAPSHGPEERVAMFRDVAGRVAPLESTLMTQAASAGPIEITGWVADRVCAPKPAIADRDGGRPPLEATLSPAPDVSARFAERGVTVQALRFVIKTDCRRAQCDLVFKGCETPIAPAPVTSLTVGFQLATGATLVRIDGIAPLGGIAAVAATSRLEGALWMLMRAIGWTYRFVVWLMMLAGTLGVALAFVRYRVALRNIPFVALAVAAGGAVIARAVLIAFVDVSSWYAVSELYLGAGSPFVALYGLAGCYLGIQALAEMGIAWPAASASSSTGSGAVVR